MQASAVNKAMKTGLVSPYLWVCCLACFGGAINRGKVREGYMIKGEFINDFIVWCLCGACAGCQEYRETTKRNPLKIVIKT